MSGLRVQTACFGLMTVGLGLDWLFALVGLSFKGYDVAQFACIGYFTAALAARTARAGWVPSRECQVLVLVSVEAFAWRCAA